jgi:hypothetical protein
MVNLDDLFYRDTELTRNYIVKKSPVEDKIAVPLIMSYADRIRFIALALCKNIEKGNSDLILTGGRSFSSDVLKQTLKLSQELEINTTVYIACAHKGLLIDPLFEVPGDYFKDKSVIEYELRQRFLTIHDRYSRDYSEIDFKLIRIQSKNSWSKVITRLKSARPKKLINYEGLMEYTESGAVDAPHEMPL